MRKDLQILISCAEVYALDQENDRTLSFTGRVFPRPFTHGGGDKCRGTKH